jgi:hypothetical protein
MPEEVQQRPSGGRIRRGVFRRPKRQEVPVGPTTGTRTGTDDDDGDAGSAGVREPRRPMPPGPLADAGERPLPEAPLLVTLPDPRR